MAVVPGFEFAKDNKPAEPPASENTEQAREGVITPEIYQAVVDNLVERGYTLKPQEEEEYVDERAPVRKNQRVKSEYELKEVALKGTQRVGSTYSDMRPLETTLAYFTDPIEQEINNNFSRVWINAAYMASRKGLRRSAAVDTAIESHIAWLTGKQSKDGKIIDAIFAQQIKQKFQSNVDSIFNKAALIGGSQNQNLPVQPPQ